MAGDPALSFVLPVHGVEAYLRPCLESVLTQAGLHDEVIAVDDASLDGCGAILDATAAADPRLTVRHHDRPAGPGAARTAGLALARGRYVWFVDADDELAPGAVSAVTARLSADQPDLLLIGYEELYPGGATAPGAGTDLLAAIPPGPVTLASRPELLQLSMTCWSKVFRREFLTGLGAGFGPGIHEDIGVSAIALLTARRVSVLAQACYRYRRARGGSFMSTSGPGQFAVFDAYEQVLARAQDLPLTDTVRGELFRRAIWHYSTVLSSRSAGAGPLRRASLVPWRDRRAFFARMHADFRRYVPPGYRRPAGARGVKFGLIARGAYRRYELLEPANRIRVALHRWPGASPR